MKIIVGLGNPGSKYSHTKHNIGFDIVDDLAVHWGVVFKNSRHQSEEASVQAPKALLSKPQTFMNLSGQSVQSTLNFYKQGTDQLIVVHDELDLPLGRIKWSSGGSAGGHNGVQSIINSLATRDFVRLRVGIGRPDKERGPDVSSWVLSKFDSEQKIKVDEVRSIGVQSVLYYLDHDLVTVMNKYNSKEI